MTNLYFTDLKDFKNTVIRITFYPDEYRADNILSAPIAIVDDQIDEAREQHFVVELRLISSMNPGSIDLTIQQSSLCRIIDDDSKWNNQYDSVSTLSIGIAAVRIGFELPSYTCLLYTSPSPRDATLSRMPSSA